ncbi:major facilitator superfamily domain-containing protein [Aspergillus venezuelensis]
MHSTAEKASVPSTIPFWRLLFDGGVVTQSMIDHEYPGSGTVEDPYVISWIPDDPRNPQLFSNTLKWILTCLVSVATLGVALVSSAYSGSVNELIEYFQMSEEVSYLGISFFVLGFAIGPLFWSPLSEIYGRRWVFIISMGTLTAFTAGAAGAQNIQTLMLMRFFGGSLGSAPMAVPGGVIADLFNPMTRGLAGGIYSAAPFLGPSLGPIIGGFISESGGWRWVQGFLALFTALLTVLLIFLLPETYGPVLLHRRAARLHSLTGHHYRSAADEHQLPTRQILSIGLSRPWILLFREPIVFLLSLYLAIIYGILYLLFAAYPIVFQQVRGWSEGKGGLAFIGVLVGILFATAYNFPLYFRYKRKALASPNGRLPPEERLPDSFPAAIALPIGLFWFAWTNSPSIHWASPIAAGVPFGFGMVMVFRPVFNYLIDAYTIYAASVLAANSLLRSVFGAVFPLFTKYMFQNLGIHWASSIPAFLALVCAPMPFAFYWYGPWVRQHSKYAAQAEAYMKRVLGEDKEEETRSRDEEEGGSPGSESPSGSG